MSNELFLIGAGFNVDALDEAGNPSGVGPYPTVNELLVYCFDDQSDLSGKSIEELFQESIESGNWEPMNSLSTLLSQADYNIPELLNATPNAYSRFLDRYKDATFLTFNYDSLLEILLFNRGLWVPDDGFGVTVQVNRENQRRASNLPKTSHNQILHLHGTFTVYASDYEIDFSSSTGMLIDRNSPHFIFDADRIANCFRPYERQMPTTGYESIERRVIAPVPEKATQEANTFIRSVNEKAKLLLEKCERLIVIGYSFNAHDDVSFRYIFEALEEQGSEVILISPDAKNVCLRLKDQFGKIQFKPYELGFSAWAEKDFPVV